MSTTARRGVVVFIDQVGLSTAAFQELVRRFHLVAISVTVRSLHPRDDVQDPDCRDVCGKAGGISDTE